MKYYESPGCFASYFLMHFRSRCMLKSAMKSTKSLSAPSTFQWITACVRRLPQPHNTFRPPTPQGISVCSIMLPALLFAAHITHSCPSFDCLQTFPISSVTRIFSSSKTWLYHHPHIPTQRKES